MLNPMNIIGNVRIYDRGELCYQEGGITGLNLDSAGFWNALAIGTEIYRVGIRFSGGDAAEVKCSCPYASGHDNPQRCKHAAALLRAIDDAAPGVMEDNDEQLVKALPNMSETDMENALSLAIEGKSPRCTAVLLNRTRNTGFSPDEFSLDDLPEDTGREVRQERQGDNSLVKLLFGGNKAKLIMFNKRTGLAL